MRRKKRKEEEDLK